MSSTVAWYSRTMYAKSGQATSRTTQVRCGTVSMVWPDACTVAGLLSAGTGHPLIERSVMPGRRS